MFSRILLVLCVCFFAGCTKQGDHQSELRANLYTEPPSLDPAKITDTTSTNVLLLIFEGLTRIGADHRPHPALAETISLSDDKKTYLFKLRKSYWSNGDPITAHDFVYAWKKILDPKSPAPFADKFYPILNAEAIKKGELPLDALGVRALDDQTLEVQLAHPTPYFLELTAFVSYYPINPRIDRKNPQWTAEAGPDYVSNGPFLLKKWDHENEIILVKNPTYWDAEKVKLDRIHFAMIDDLVTEYYMYEMDELDWTGSPLSNISPDFLPELRKEGKLIATPSSATYYYKLNLDVYPLHNKKIRQALAYAINRQEIVDHIQQGGQLPATALVPPMPGWEEPSHLFKDNDRKKAKRLFFEGLREEGLTLKTFPVLTMSYNTNREHEKIAQAIQHQWKDVLGIKVRLEKSDWKVYLAKLARRDFEIGRLGWVGDYFDPICFLVPFKYRNDSPSGVGNNGTGWENAAYIATINQAIIETDLQKRRELLRKAEEILVDEMPLIPVFYLTFLHMRKPYLKGAYISPLGYVDFKEAYIEQ